MGVDTDMAIIVRDIVQFLESLGDIDLPLKIENARESLLQRTKSKLATLTSSRGGSASPEPYLDMNAGKGLLERNKSQHIEIEEYVGVEDKSSGARTSSHQDYYESFNESCRAIVDKIIDTTSLDRDEEFEGKLREIYASFTRTETIGKAIKYGSLEQKIGRKTFLLGRGVRPCWMGLVGSHLIIYGSNDNKPSKIYSIKGYVARAAPNAMPKSAFEIVCPGNETLQFIASTAEEMDEWVAAINVREFDARISEETIETKRSDELKFADVGVFPTGRKPEESVLPTTARSDLNNIDGREASISGCGVKNDSISSLGHSPPALPVRAPPRRLPSLPNEKILNKPSYESMDDGYEEEDIYHKIDDFGYENLKGKSGNGVCEQGRAKKANKRKKCKKEPKESQKSCSPKEIIETYDDVQTIARDTRISKNSKSLEDASSEKDESFLTYDDVAQTFPTVRAESSSIGESCNSKVEQSPVKSPSKKWFRLGKDSSRKEDKIRKKFDKREKEKNALDATPRDSEGLDLPAYYDDVSDLINKQKIDDISNYNCPPPPRPVYVKPPNHAQVPELTRNEAIAEQVYDDILNYRDSGMDVSREEDQKETLEENNDAKSTVDNRVSVDSEHYQTPRKNCNHSNRCFVMTDRQDEQRLYDDIAILADFRAKQRDSMISTDEKTTITIKRPWNRFGSGKKTSSRDVAAESKSISSNDLEDACDSHSVVASSEKHDAASKLNKLQKLYNKVEITLGKQPSSKSINSLANKTRRSE